MTKNKTPVDGSSAAAVTHLSAKVTKIAALATRLAEYGGALQTTTWSTQLDDLLLGYLSSGRDDVLLEALQAAIAKGGYEAGDEVRSRLECFATSMLVESDDNQEFALTLAAVPVVVVANESAFRTSGVLEDSKLLDRIAKSLKRHQMARKDATVFALPYLYDVTELGKMTFSGVRKLSRNAFSPMFGKPAGDAAALGQSGWPIAEGVAQDNTDVRLLYLVLGHVDAPDVTAFCVSPDATDEENEAYDTHLKAWSHEATPLVRELIGTGQFDAFVGAPAPFYEGFEQGMEHHREISFSLATSCVLHEQELQPADVRSVITLYGIEGELVEFRVSYVDPQTSRVLCGAVFPAMPWNHPEDDLEDLRDFLKRTGFTDIAHSSEIIEAEAWSLAPGADEAHKDADDKAASAEPEWKGHTLH